MTIPKSQNITLENISLSAADELNALAKKHLLTDLKAAEHTLKEADNISRKLNYEKGIAEAARSFAHIAMAQNRTADAFQFIKEALALFQKINFEKGIAMSLNDLGNINFKISDYTKASKYYFESLQLKEKLGDKKGAANTLLNLGSVYQKQNNYAKAVITYKRSLRIAQRLKEQSLVASVENNLGEILIAQRKYGHALKHLEIAAELSLKTGDKIKLACVYNNIGSAWMLLHNNTEAMNAFSHCVNISKTEKLKVEFYSASINMAEVLIRQKKYTEAEKMLLPVVAECKKQDNKHILQRAYGKMSDLYASQKKYQKTIRFYNLSNRIQLQLLNEENIRQTNELSIRFDVQQKEKEAEIFRLKNVEMKSMLSKLNDEKKRSDNLLKNILPVKVAEDLKAHGKSPVQYFESVSVMFADIKDFTVFSQTLSPEELVKELDYCFMKFDEIIDKYGIEKIKTIGDAYLCASGLPIKKRGHALRIVSAAKDFLAFIAERKTEKEMRNEPAFEIRIGIHSGPVIAGIIGTKKFAYDIWGDTVNTAARMEQSSAEGKINISDTTHQLIKHKINCTYRGKIAAKNKGEIDMYFVND